MCMLRHAALSLCLVLYAHGAVASMMFTPIKIEQHNQEIFSAEYQLTIDKFHLQPSDSQYELVIEYKPKDTESYIVVEIIAMVDAPAFDDMMPAKLYDTTMFVSDLQKLDENNRIHVKLPVHHSMGVLQAMGYGMDTVKQFKVNIQLVKPGYDGFIFREQVQPKLTLSQL